MGLYFLTKVLLNILKREQRVEKGMSKRERQRIQERGKGKERDGVPGSAYKKRGGHLDHRQQE